MRGYVADRDKLPGYEKGILPTSYYYATIGNKFAMHKYAPLHGAFFNREVSICVQKNSQILSNHKLTRLLNIAVSN